MHQLFPPYLNKGSKDIGAKGPVRRLQEALVAFYPGAARMIGLEVNGDYDLKTAVLVAVAQDNVNLILDNVGQTTRAEWGGWLEADGHFGPATMVPAARCASLRWLEADGHFGPATRKACKRWLKNWPLDGYERTKFIAGSECMYVGPDSPEPILWNPLAEVVATIANTDDVPTQPM